MECACSARIVNAHSPWLPYHRGERSLSVRAQAPPVLLGDYPEIAPITPCSDHDGQNEQCE
jgi:hypothetical protein